MLSFLDSAEETLVLLRCALRTTRFSRSSKYCACNIRVTLSDNSTIRAQHGSVALTVRRQETVMNRSYNTRMVTTAFFLNNMNMRERQIETEREIENIKSLIALTV